MEVVLPTGELMRTGMGAMPDPTQPHVEGGSLDEQPGNKCWQVRRNLWKHNMYQTDTALQSFFRMVLVRTMTGFLRKATLVS